MLDVREYIESHGIEVMRDEGSELACLCPFHVNKDTPAFYINKNTGLWICFNPSCERKGSIKDLMFHFGDSRPIVKNHSVEDIQFLLSYEEDKEVMEDWASVLDEIKIDFAKDSSQAQYLLDRGFEASTLSYFEIGYAKRKRRLVIPARDENSRLVGFIGRALDDDVTPKYLYSKGFPRKSVLFNLNHAKHHRSVIITEGSLDAMKVHQAGFPNVVATLGAAVTEEHSSLLRRYFDEIIIFGDDDEAGLSMQRKLVGSLCGYLVKIVSYDNLNGKDAGEMSAEDVRSAILTAEDSLTAGHSPA